MKKLKRVLSLPDIWIYDNFSSTKLHQNLLYYFENFKDNTVNNFEGRTLNFKDNQYRLVDTREHRRYHLLWNLSYDQNYWNQTNDTIFSWFENTSKNIIPHICRYLINDILKVSPFIDYNGKWIPVRGIYNLLEPNVPLDPHIDGNIYITNGETYSATYYIDAEGEGGEFWDSRGFYYKPKNNSLLINIGSNSVHGVRPSSQFRSGITIRFVKEKELILPGSIDKLLYKPII